MKDQALQKSKIKYLLRERIHPSAIDALAKGVYGNVDCYLEALPDEELMAETKDARFVGIRSWVQLSAEVIELAPRVVEIGCFFNGTNQFDLDTVSRNGIPVFNAPLSYTRSMLELVIAEVIFLLRVVPQRSATR